VTGKSFGLEDFKGLSSDQFYRRVKLLESEGLVSTFRGKSNRILLDAPGGLTFGQFLALEQNHPKAGLQWCLERFRYEQEKARSERLESSLDFSRTEVKQLRYALVKIRRSPWSRLWRRLYAWGSGLRRIRSEDEEERKA